MYGSLAGAHRPWRAATSLGQLGETIRAKPGRIPKTRSSSGIRMVSPAQRAQCWPSFGSGLAIARSGQREERDHNKDVDPASESERAPQALTKDSGCRFYLFFPCGFLHPWAVRTGKTKDGAEPGLRPKKPNTRNK